MLINADFKALEWLGAAFLSKCPVAYDEINRGVDQHSLNQTAFGLPSRLIAKTFVFRLIYGGSAYSYANDADFAGVSVEEQFWQSVIDKFYLKYHGIRAWHNHLEETARLTGRIVIPTGRVFTFSPEMKYGRLRWPRTTILNYPVQGFGADLMVIARLLVKEEVEKLNDKRILFVSTVHDSILIDAPRACVSDIVRVIFRGWNRIPDMFESWFNVALDLPCKVEVQVGMDWKNMEEVKE